MERHFNYQFNSLEDIEQENTVIERFKIFKQRPIMIVWLCAYIFLSWGLWGFSFGAFITTMIIYAFIVSVALSDIIEKIMRFIEDVRRVATRTEKERLLHIFDEVYQTAKDKSTYMSNDIKLYIVDDISVNAFALGRGTIAVTRGLMNVMNDDEIKGILAHEFGHMAYNDTSIQLLVTVGSTIYLWIFLAVKWILGALVRATSNPDSNNKSTLISSFIGFFRWLNELGIMLFTVVATIILMADSRKKEYRADEYANQLGYGEELINALYKLYDMQISDKRNMIEKIKSSHPRLAYRIEALELGM